MGFIEAALGDAPEEQLPPEGAYDLRIVHKATGTNKAETRKQVKVLVRIEADEDYQPINHYLTFPNDEDWQDRPDTAKLMLRGINRFLEVFNVPNQANGFNDDDLDGATGKCLVTHRAPEDAGGDVYPELRLPRMSK